MSCPGNRLSHRGDPGAQPARREEGAYPRRYSTDLVGRSPAKTTESRPGRDIGSRMSTYFRDRTLSCVSHRSRATRNCIGRQDCICCRPALCRVPFDVAPFDAARDPPTVLRTGRQGRRRCSPHAPVRASGEADEHGGLHGLREPGEPGMKRRHVSPPHEAVVQDRRRLEFFRNLGPTYGVQAIVA